MFHHMGGRNVRPNPRAQNSGAVVGLLCFAKWVSMNINEPYAVVNPNPLSLILEQRLVKQGTISPNLGQLLLRSHFKWGIFHGFLYVFIAFLWESWSEKVIFIPCHSGRARAVLESKLRLWDYRRPSILEYLHLWKQPKKRILYIYILSIYIYYIYIYYV